VISTVDYVVDHSRLYFSISSPICVSSQTIYLCWIGCSWRGKIWKTK